MEWLEPRERGAMPRLRRDVQHYREDDLNIDLFSVNLLVELGWELCCAEGFLIDIRGDRGHLMKRKASYELNTRNRALKREMQCLTISICEHAEAPLFEI